MRQSSALLALSAVSSAMAVPFTLSKKADYSPLPGGDKTILNYALTLEYLERKFYQEGLKNYTQADFQKAGFDSTFYSNLQEIAFDEKKHVSFLAGALGPDGIAEPSFRFPSTDAASFVALSSVLEGVGVSAYLGAAAAIVDKTYLTAAGAILTVEARHSSYIRAALKQSPFPKPYDTPLDFNQVYSLAAQFITSFAPGTPDLPFKAFPPLTAVTSDKVPVAGKSSVTFKDAYKNAQKAGLVSAKTPVYAVFFSGLDTYYAKVEIRGNDYYLAKIPGANYAYTGQLPPSGQVYAVLSTADGNKVRVKDENTLSGVAVHEVNSAEGKKDCH